jgi:hypothetical protein
MQNTFLYEGMSQCVRSLNRSDAYPRPLLYVNANLYGDHGQLHPALARRDVKLPRQSLEGVQRTDCCHPYGAYQPRSGRKPAKQAGSPQMDWFKLRFDFRWYSALLKCCSADKAHAGRNAFRVSALLRPKISGRKSPKERFVQRKLHKATPVSRKSGLEPERKPELGTSISICCRIGQPGAETCR